MDVAIEGVVESLVLSGASQGTTTSAVDGSYSFAGIDPGTYYVQLTPPAGFGVTAQDQGFDDAFDSDIDPDGLTSLPFTVAAGQNRTDIDAGLLAGASIGGRAWLDGDLDGLQDGGEAAFASPVTVELFTAAGVPQGMTSTAVDGSYLFTDLAAGSYYLVFSEPAGFCYTLQDQGTDDSLDSDIDPLNFATAPIGVSAGQVSTDIDAGLVPDASVGNRVWLDDGNGIQDGGEAGVAGVTVQLFDSQDHLLDTTMTAADGNYSFAPGPGEYYLAFALPADRTFAPRHQGTDDGADSDVNPASGTTSTFVLGPGTVNSDLDAGLEPTGIGDRVWIDANHDGLQQPGESGMPGVTVRLLDENDVEIASTRTDAFGVYRFGSVPSGTYRIEIQAGVGDGFTTPDVGANDLLDSDVDPATGRSALFSHTSGSANRGHDAGLLAIFANGFESGDTSGW
ncbi:MAG: SdrD B-like domain-containing protein, partial [Acidobacteriota bacterium]